MTKIFMSQRKGFTIIEMLLVITGFFVILTTIINIYIRMINLKNNVEAKENLIQSSYYMFERFNVLTKDFTIDYEEYYNRKMVGCDSPSNYNASFSWDISGGSKNGNCDRFTTFGNQNSIAGGDTYINSPYYCSSSTGEITPYLVIKSGNVLDGSGCFDSLKFTAPYYQSYGQYKQHFWDMGNDVDYVLGAPFDEDDYDIGEGPSAIADQDSIQELYLISQDGTKRIYLRRKLISTGDRNYDGILSGDMESRYNIQILRLKGFDAGESHNFASTSKGVYDGKIDTRACDYAEGFICNGNSIDPTIYSGYKIPSNSDDGRVNMFEKNLTISDWGIKIYPTKDPENAWLEDSSQINPYFTITLTNKLYGEIWKKKIPGDSINNFKFTLQTTFNTKSFYTKY